MDRQIDITLQQDLLKIQDLSVKMIDSILSIAIEFMQVDPNIQKELTGKVLKKDFFERLIGFSQMFYQGMKDINDDLIQLPLVNYNNLDQIKKKLKNKDLKQVLENQQYIEKISEIVKVENYLEYIQIFKNSIPQTEVSISILDDLKQQVAPSELKTSFLYKVNINIKWLNKFNGEIHSDFFKMQKKEKLYALTYSENNQQMKLINVWYQTLKSSEMLIEFDIYFPQQVEIVLHVFLYSDCYCGTQIQHSIAVKANNIQQSFEQEEQIVNDADLEALQQGSFIQRLQKTQEEEYSEEEEEPNTEK